MNFVIVIFPNTMNVHGPIGVVYGKRKDCLQLPFCTSKKVIFVQMNLDMRMNGLGARPSQVLDVSTFLYSHD